MKRIIPAIILILGIVPTFGEGLIRRDKGYFISERVDSLKGQRVFYSSQDWIPPSPPDEPCVQIGCCLIPLTGCLIGYNVFAKAPDTTKVLSDRKFSIGISYSPGVAYTGWELQKSLKGHEIDPFMWFYWNNVFETNLLYHFKPDWAVGLGSGYMWARMENRINNLDIGDDTPISSKWEIYGLSFSGLITRLWETGRNVASLSIGLEYYLSKGTDYEEFYVYESDPLLRYKKIAKNWGRGLGGVLSIGLEKNINSTFDWFSSLSIRFGNANEYKYSIPENTSWEDRVDLCFAGIYAKIGLRCTLLKQEQ